MIPANQYDPKRADDLLWYLIDEIRRTMGDRKIQEANWLKYERIYRARPIDERKTFPFTNASNLVIPLAATDVDTLYSRMMGMLFEPPGIWSATAQRPELVDFASATQEFFQWAQENEIKPYRSVGNWLLEMHKLGTGVMKQRYVREMQKVFEWRELDNQTWQQQAVVMLKDHPEISHVRLWDAYIPAGFTDIQQAPWFAERVRLTWMQFMNRVKAGLYTNADKVGAWFFNPPMNTVQQGMDDLSQFRPSINKQMEFYEFWLNFDIDGDGWDEALVCTIHLDSQTYVRLDYNPFFNQEKPYSAGCFMRDVNSFYGIGLCEMLDHFQEEITAMHNQRIDNGTVMLSQMWAVKKDNMAIRKDEPTYPGKIWRLTDPKNDIVALPLGQGMGTAMAAAVNSEAATRAEGMKRTGVNDYVAGNTGPSTAYGTAYTTHEMLLNASKRFGETLREVRAVLSESGTRILELYQQFNQRGKPFVALGQRDGMLVNVVLKFPLDLIRKGLSIGVTAIDSQLSRDAQIRTTTLVYQQLSQFYQNYMQMLSYVGNPQMPPAIKQVAMVAAEGSAVLMRKLLELYGQQDYDRMIPSLDGGVGEQQRQLSNIQAVLQSAQMGGSGPQSGGPGAPLPPPQNGGMGNPAPQGSSYSLGAGYGRPGNADGYSGSVPQSGRMPNA